MTAISNIPGMHILMLSMLAFATVAFTLTALVTVSNAWRLRNPLLSWRAGKLYGFPLFATIFLAFTLMAGVTLYMKGITSELPWIACYVWIATMWWFSSYQLSKRYITDHGIVKNLNDPSQTVAWSSINDYIVEELPEGINFRFLYLMYDTDHQIRRVARLDLFVPGQYTEEFTRLLNHKLHRSFSEFAPRYTGQPI